MVLVLGTREAMGVCPAGWLEYGPQNKCFRFFGTKTSWLKAQSDCRNNGGDLASIEDQATNDFVSGTVLAGVSDSSHYHQVFIGGWQYEENGYGADKWAWVDGVRQFSDNWANWADNQVDDEGVENCMSMMLYNDAWNVQTNQVHVRGKWNDVSCSRENWFPYICSRWNTADETEYIGSCGYITGSVIDKYNPVNLMITCCNGAVKNCGNGNGVSCETVCGADTPDYLYDFVSTEDDNDSEQCAKERPRCSTGRSLSRSRRQNQPIWTINWCVHKVRNVSAISNNSANHVCCFHPWVRRYVPGVISTCASIIG